MAARGFSVVRNTKAIHQELSVAHFHDAIEILLFESLQGQALIDNHIYNLSGPTIVSIPPFIEHEMRIDQGGDAPYAAKFPVELVEMLGLPHAGALNQAVVISLRREEHQHLQNLFEWYMDDSVRRTPEWKEQIIRLVLVWLSEKREQTDAPSGGKPFSKIRSKRFLPLLNSFNEKQIYSLSTEKAARITGLSKSRFCHAFKQDFGISFQEYMHIRRMRSAAAMLVQGDCSISQIAQKLDFNNVAYFAKRFRELHGMTPSDFRHHLRRKTPQISQANMAIAS